MSEIGMNSSDDSMNHGKGEDAMTPAEGPWRAIRRGVWIGLVLVVLCSMFDAYGEIRLGAELVNSSLMVTPVFVLLLIAIGNARLARQWPGMQLDRRELLTIYILLIVSLCIGGKGMIEMLLPTIAEARYYASRRRWGAVSDALPRWWQPDPGSLPGFFIGHHPLPWKAWLIPFLTWGTFLTLLLFTTFCICILLRRQWIERERLVFPITVLPIELIRSNENLLHSRAMWTAFVLVFLVESLNSLHQWFPSLPSIPIKSSPELDISAAFTSPPWNALKGWTISFYPFAIGIAFLLTTEVAFSCWFFYLLVTRVEVVAGAALGRQGRFPYVGEQGAGAYFGFALLVLWIARAPVMRACRRLLRVEATAEGGDEPGGMEKVAGLGLLLGVAALAGFCLLGGSSLRIVLLFWAVTLAMMITITRARAEGGTVWALGPDTAASLEVLRITGTAGVSAASLALMAVMQFFTNDWRALVMPNQMEALKIAHSSEIPARRLLVPLALATLLGIIVSFWASLAVWYHFGCASSSVDNWGHTWGAVPWFFGRSWNHNPMPPDIEGLRAVGVGALTVFILAALRTRFLWWPLHPIGYVLGSSGDLGQVWFCFFLGWIIKSLVLRYGGRRLFSRILPFFLGLILGDYAAFASWTLVGMLFNAPVYKVFP